MVIPREVESLEKLGFIGRDKETRDIMLTVLKEMKISRGVFFKGSYAYIRKGRLVDIAEVAEFFKKEALRRQKLRK